MSLDKIIAAAFVLLPISCTAPKTSTYAEAEDPCLEMHCGWSQTSPGLHGAILATDRVYPRSASPDIEETRSLNLRGWKGEKVSAQILFWSAEDTKRLRIKPLSFKGNARHLSLSSVKISFERYVLTDEFGEVGEAHDADKFPTHLQADLLDELDQMDLEAESVRPVWISISIPRDATAGIYTLKLKARAGGARPQEYQIRIEVMERTLPEPSEWSYHLDLWQHPAAIARAEGVELWSEEHFKAMRAQMELLAAAGQKVITCTLNKDPWNHQCYDAYEDMIVWNRLEDGSWQYDYSIFDRYVEMMMGIGIRDAISCYSILPWNNEIHYNDIASGTVIDINASPGTENFDLMWRPFLCDFKKHLEGKGWLGITNMAADERSREDMEAVLNLIGETTPELGIAMADNKGAFRNYPQVNYASVACHITLTKEEMAERHSLGKIVSYYVCCADKFPNMFSFSDPMESVFAGWYAVANNYDGFLRWAYNSWPENPEIDSRYPPFPAGDTFLTYPHARSSIRMEKIIEGIQDAEKIRILRTEDACRPAVDSLVAHFGFWSENWKADLAEARDRLNDF